MHKQQFCFLFLLYFLFCMQPAEAKRNKLTITGSTTILPIAQAAAEEFMKLHPQVNISIRGGGSGVGISSLISKTCDIAATSRAMQTYEKTTAKARGVEPIGYVIANDALQVIVHKSNPVHNLSLMQLKQIYAGLLTNWKQVGGENRPIVVISRDVASGTFETFNKKVMGPARVKDSAMMLASNNAIMTTVASTPGAIGYVGIGYDSKRVNVVAVNGVMPSQQTVQNQTYTLARSLYMYTNGRAKGDTAGFLSFLQSRAGQKIVMNQGFLPYP